MTAERFKNHFLIAMPGLAGSSFSQTVTYICEHHHNGAMGIVINQAVDMTKAELFKHLDLNNNYKDDSPLLAGGPVQKERGFVLHTGPAKKLGSRPSPFLTKSPSLAPRIY